MSDAKRIAAAASITIQDGDVLLILKAATGEAVQLVLDKGMVAGLAVGLFGIGGKLKNSDEKGLTSQIMTLTASIPAIGPQGQPILDLVLEGGMHFPVTFPKGAIPILQNALATLQEKSTEQKPPARN